MKITVDLNPMTNEVVYTAVIEHAGCFVPYVERMDPLSMSLDGFLVEKLAFGERAAKFFEQYRKEHPVLS